MISGFACEDDDRHLRYFLASLIGQQSGRCLRKRLGSFQIDYDEFSVRSLGSRWPSYDVTSDGNTIQ